MNESIGHGFLHSALVFLACAVLFVPIAQRLKLGSVLGYLVGGIAIGPWGLGVITNVEDILHFSEFGVVLFLFLIGLELEPKRLWEMRMPIFGFGSAQLVLNTVVIGSLGLALGLSWSAALIAGLGLALSSTAIALQVLKEKNILVSQAGQSAFSILLFQDIAVIPILALLPLLASLGSLGVDPNTVGHVGSSALKPVNWVSFGKTIGVLIAVIVFGRLLIRPILRAIASAHLREIFTAFALLLVVSMAALMQSLELSMGLGAFLAGVLLADSEYKHALETDIEPFKGLLLGLFFISVGMSIDIGAVSRDPLKVLAITLSIFFVKSLSHFSLGRLFRLPRSQVPFFSLVISQVGEFAFVLFAAAKAAGLLADDQVGPLVASAAISMLLSPLVNFIFDRWIEPRFQSQGKPGSDEIENHKPTVIIAGFGRFGQIVGRMLYANGITATVLDYEPDQVELLRKFGFKIYYGDATREDLLIAAGAHDAKILVVAIDGVEDSLRLIDLAKKEFPHLKIFTRARNVQHIYQIMDRDIEGFERETFESSLRLATKVLAGLGWPRHSAWRAANSFRRHNYGMIDDLYKLRDNQTELVARTKQARADLEKMFERERERLEVQSDGWS